MKSMIVTKNEVRGAYKYYGLFYVKEGSVISAEYILKSKDMKEKVLFFDYDDGTWHEIEKADFQKFAGTVFSREHLSEMSEEDALWFLEQHQAFNGEGDDAAVAAFLGMWTEKKEQFREAWKTEGGWPAKYVKTTFYLKGKQYVITPDSIGLEKGECWDEGFMEFLQGDIGTDLKALGAEEIRHVGFLD